MMPPTVYIPKIDARSRYIALLARGAVLPGVTTETPVTWLEEHLVQRLTSRVDGRPNRNGATARGGRDMTTSSARRVGTLLLS